MGDLHPNREVLPIPANLTPEEFICFCFKLPKDRQHLGAFWGAVGALAKRYSWGKPLSADSQTVADYWQTLLVENRQSFDEEIDMAGCAQPCCPDPISRVDGNGVAQVSFDNGTTYSPDASDVRMGIIPLPPLPGDDGDTKRCRAATALAEGYKSATDQLINTANAWITVGGLIEAVTLILTAIFGFAAPIAVAIVSAVAFALFLIGSAALDAAMTTQVYHDLECIFYCRVGDNGTFSEAEWQLVKSDINSDFTGIAQFYLWNWTNALGPNGLNILTRILPVGAVDCSDCACQVCTPESIKMATSEAGEWVAAQVINATTVRLTSFFTAAGRPCAWYVNDNPSNPSCCNVLTWENFTGENYFIVNRWICGGLWPAGPDSTGGLPSSGCWESQQIFGDIGDPAFTIDMVIGEECV